MASKPWLRHHPASTAPRAWTGLHEAGPGLSATRFQAEPMAGQEELKASGQHEPGLETVREAKPAARGPGEPGRPLWSG